MDNIILNGEIVKRSTVKIDIEDRGYQFGDGIYEVVRVYNGRLYAMEAHIERLYESARKIRLNLPQAKEALTEQLEKLVQMNELNTGIIYLQFTRGVSMRQHGFPGSEVSPVFVAYTKEMERPAALMDHGVKGMLAEDVRWLRCDIKSLNLLGNILAKQDAADNGCFEAIQHRGNIVTEGSSSNVFIVKEGVLYTHPATNLILNGITRQILLGICEENGMKAAEKAFSIDELLSADEVFITSTTSEVMPIVELYGKGMEVKKVGDGTPGELTKRLQELFSQTI